MCNAVATVIFASRNANKTANENIGKLPVTVGQCVTGIKAGAQYNNAVSKQIKVVLNIIYEVAKNDKVFGGLTKAVNFAANHVNHFIVGSSGLNVLTAKKEDRKKTIIAESGSLAGMFIGEGLMKKHLDGVLAKLPISKKWAPIVKGVTFVIGSITSSNIGKSIGEKAAKHIDNPAPRKIDYVA